MVSLSGHRIHTGFPIKSVFNCAKVINMDGGYLLGDLDKAHFRSAVYAVPCRSLLVRQQFQVA